MDTYKIKIINMRYLKLFENYDDKDLSKIDWIFKNYKSDEVKGLNADINDSASGGIVLAISWRDKSGYNSFNIFSGKDGNNRVATMGSYDNWPIITDSEFNRYKKGVQEISDYLDSVDNVSKSSIGDNINLNIDINDINYMEAQENLKNLLKGHFNKELKFEAEFYEWYSNSKNIKKIEDITLSVYDISGELRQEEFYLDVKCKLDNKKMYFLVDEDSLDEYLEISNIPKKDRYYKLLHLNYDDRELSRIEKRKLEKERKKFPKVISYDMVPSNWPAIEFIKDCKNIINTFNEELKKNN
jgi:hypothetical protein